ncbi:MAG: pyridoxamine 5'-phosphate oxidase [Gemmatimonadaceae bacterium]
MSLADVRREYSLASLDLADVHPDPTVQFQRWFDDARRAELLEPNAMTLATVATDGRPSARVVLLKEVTANGFVFFTNYRSRKASDLDAGGLAALVFFWKEVERQVRIEGRVTRIAPDESASYFHSRPRGSQIGAWASPQSAVISDRRWLEQEMDARDAEFAGREVPAPAHWGGYRVVPDCLEFWQGRPNRLHDRLRYRRDGGSWVIERLAP